MSVSLIIQIYQYKSLLPRSLYKLLALTMQRDNKGKACLLFAHQAYRGSDCLSLVSRLVFAHDLLVGGQEAPVAPSWSIGSHVLK